MTALDLMREVSKAWEMVFDNGEGVGDTIKKRRYVRDWFLTIFFRFF